MRVNDPVPMAAFGNESLLRQQLLMLSSAPSPIEVFDAVDEALSWHDGDARATIETLLKDCSFLREQLGIASKAISHGMTRGWMPKTERAD